ncbi:MAG: ABC transporter permease [Thermoprotei archaeon]
MNPVLYDFKRGFLRPAALIALAIFVLAGIGSSYLIGATLMTRPGGGITAVYSYVDPEEQEYGIEVLLLDSDLRPVRGAISYEISYIKQVVVETDSGKIVRSSGEEEVIISGVLEIGPDGKGAKVERVDKSLPSGEEAQYMLDITITTAFGMSGYRAGYLQLVSANKAIYAQAHIFGIPSSFPILYYRVVNDTVVLKPDEAGSYVHLTHPRDEIHALAVCAKIPKENTSELELVVIASFFSINRTGYDVYVLNPSINSSTLPAKIGVNELGEYFVYIGRIYEGVNMLTKSINYTGDLEELKTKDLYVLLLDSSSDDKSYIVFQGIPYVTKGSQVERQVFPVLISIGPSLFATFSPIVLLYLAYVYIAKPRSQGALEFVLARPITRFELYNTRFLAGVLVAIVLTTVFYASLYASNYSLLGIMLDPNNYLLLFMGSLLSLVAFYSLFYFFSALTSGTRYLVVSILLFFVFVMFFQLIVSLVAFLIGGIGPGFFERYFKIQLVSYYFKPDGIFNLMQYYVQKQLEILSPQIIEVFDSVFNPVLAGVSTASWIAIPYTLGWLVFRKANLSS